MQGKVNNGLLMSWPHWCFVSYRKQIVRFVSEVTGLKMSAEIRSGGVKEEREKKDILKADNK